MKNKVPTHLLQIFDLENLNLLKEIELYDEKIPLSELKPKTYIKFWDIIRNSENKICDYKEHKGVIVFKN